MLAYRKVMLPRHGTFTDECKNRSMLIRCEEGAQERERERAVFEPNEKVVRTDQCRSYFLFRFSSKEGAKFAVEEKFDP